jgi:hypothetical protein
MSVVGGLEGLSGILKSSQSSSSETVVGSESQHWIYCFQEALLVHFVADRQAELVAMEAGQDMSVENVVLWLTLGQA